MPSKGGICSPSREHNRYLTYFHETEVVRPLQVCSYQLWIGLMARSRSDDLDTRAYLVSHMLVSLREVCEVLTAAWIGVSMAHLLVARTGPTPWA